VLFWLGQVIGVQELGLTLIMSLIDLPDSMKRAMAR
jgi:hypothetical protein